MTRDSKVARNILRRLLTCEEKFWHGNNLASSWPKETQAPKFHVFTSPNNIYQEIGFLDTLTSSEVENLCAHHLEHQKAERSPSQTSHQNKG